MRGKTVAFTGNSGVGKSSILNCLGFSVETGEVSEKLGRGRHTTRHVELFPLADGTCVIDTPGFSSFDTEQMELILKENLQYAFPDFAPYLGRCRYHDCAHLSEPAVPCSRRLRQASWSRPAMPAMQGSMKQQRRSGFGNTNSPDFWARCPAAAGGISMRCARRNRL